MLNGTWEDSLPFGHMDLVLGLFISRLHDVEGLWSHMARICLSAIATRSRKRRLDLQNREVGRLHTDFLVLSADSTVVQYLRAYVDIVLCWHCV